MTPGRGEQVLRIGTRGSELALWQATEVARLLRLAHPGLIVERQIIRTVGDRVLGTPLSQIGDKGLFTRELEEALVGGTIDLAVHSLKDLPTRLPDGLELGVVLEREDPRDVLVAPPGVTLATLPPRFRVGTSSLRRRAQLLFRQRDLELLDVRGNLPTRIAKLDRGDYDALVLARAGLVRLGLGDRIAEAIAPELIVPAVGQGALGIETRVGDRRVDDLLAPLEHRPTRLATSAERAFLGRLEGGCQVPIGALATMSGATLTLMGVVADIDGATAVRGSETGEVRDVEGACVLGTRLADGLLGRGAAAILERVRLAAARGGAAGQGSAR